jgi:ATP-dependent phosphofructokinase / diphosphate-dependent phosphofructokinase
MENAAMDKQQGIKRIGVLTGGGDCPGLNAVIRAVVKTASNEYGWEVWGIEDGFDGLIQPGHAHLLSLSDVRGILPRGGTILGTTNRSNPFHYSIEKDGRIEYIDLSGDVMRRIEELQIEVLVVIGGDGSLRIAYELMEKGLKVVAVPKTIDNDLPGTTITFGFDTALRTAVEALDKLHTTAESHHRVIILEVMGRDAGWIALHAGIAGGADVILIPEIPFSYPAVYKVIDERHQRGAKFSLIVAAEGAFPEGGAPVYQSSFAKDRLGGIAEQIAQELSENYKLDVRVTVLGHLQRGGSPTAFDRLLASRFGARAVQAIAQGESGVMVALVNDHLATIPLAEVAYRQKFVPLDSDLLFTARGLGISLGSSRELFAAS